MVARARLLDIDPELGEELDDDRRRIARQLVVRVGTVPAGRWTPEADAFAATGGLGLVIVDGLAARRLSLGHRSAAELLGAGDVLRPWEDDGEHAQYPFEASFRVIEALRLAVLDQATTAHLARYPEIVNRLVGRVMMRARRTAGHLVVAQFSSVETRLLVVLWHLADRFGRVTPEGISVPLPLTHELLGLLVGARRPSVTTALSQLEERGLVVRRRGDAGWLLRGDPPEPVARARGTQAGRDREAAQP